MIKKTLVIFGPGGIGKSPIDELVRADAVRIDPYRLRPSGPRDREDVFYAHPRLRSELSRVLVALGDSPERLSDTPAVDWFARSRLTMFDVRGEWQCLILGGQNAPLAKAEIYAPAAAVLLRRQDIRQAFGSLTVVVLNPVAPLRSLAGDFSALRSATHENCAKRGDSTQSIDKRTKFIDEEARAWINVLDAGGTEFANWEFPEYVYRGNEVTIRRAVRTRLIAGNPDLGDFLKTDADLGTQ